MTNDQHGGRAGPARVVWFELRTPDLERSARFYTELLGWRFRSFEEYREDYWLIEGATGGPGGALVAGESSQGRVGGAMVYVEVDAVEPVLDLARSLGGQVLVERTVITGEAGVFAVVADPCGTSIGLWAAR